MADEKERLGAVLCDMTNVRRLIRVASASLNCLESRIQYELTRKPLAKRIKAKELPKLTLAIANLSTMAERFEAALDAKTERLVE
jgi:hypothetical protein